LRTLHHNRQGGHRRLCPRDRGPQTWTATLRGRRGEGGTVPTPDRARRHGTQTRAIDLSKGRVAGIPGHAIHGRDGGSRADLWTDLRGGLRQRGRLHGYDEIVLRPKFRGIRTDLCVRLQGLSVTDEPQAMPFQRCERLTARHDADRCICPDKQGCEGAADGAGSINAKLWRPHARAIPLITGSRIGSGMAE
jgi:hypothetical protein